MKSKEGKKDLVFKVSTDALTLKEGETGRFTGYASVWGVPDDQGDVMVKGAFAASIEAYQEEGRTFPIRYMHQPGPVGYIDKIEEDDHGLYIEGVISHESSERAAEAYAFVKSRTVAELSVGFYYVPGALSYNEEDQLWYVYDVDLKEVSLVDVGSNSETRVLSIKQQAEKENEVDSDLLRAQSMLDSIANKVKPENDGLIGLGKFLDNIGEH